MGWVSCAQGCVTAVSQYCHTHGTVCPTNTPVQTVFVKDKIVRWTRGGGGVPAPPPLKSVIWPKKHGKYKASEDNFSSDYTGTAALVLPVCGAIPPPPRWGELSRYLGGGGYKGGGKISSWAVAASDSFAHSPCWMRDDFEGQTSAECAMSEVQGGRCCWKGSRPIYKQVPRLCTLSWGCGGRRSMTAQPSRPCTRRRG